MPTIELTKDIEGRLCGATEKDNVAYEKFMRRAIALTHDESIIFSWKEPRSGPYHRRHFVMLSTVFKAQETFLDSDVFRKWLEIEAGYCDSVPGKDGPIKVPKSIAYDKLDQAEFEPLHKAVFEFMRGEFALSVIWPHMTWQQGYNMLDGLLREFDQPMSGR